MKRKSVVFLTAVLIFLAGCVASGIPSESEYVQTGISKYITEENGKYTLTLLRIGEVCQRRVGNHRHKTNSNQQKKNF